MTRGKSRQAGIPTVRCAHVAYSTGERCRNPARVGTTVCHMHLGNAPQIARKAELRATVAQLMQHVPDDDPRTLGEVMLEAVHNADVIMRSLTDVRLRVLRGEEVELADVDRLLEMSKAAQHLAESTTRAGVQVELVRQARLSRDLNGAHVTDVIGAVLDALIGWPNGVLAPLGLGYLDELRRWVHDVVMLELEAVEEPAQASLDPDRPVELSRRRVTYPPPPPFPGDPPAALPAPPPPPRQRWEED